ncbi:MAG: cyclic pyranopterin monophosphate synthase MoaC [Planctomycetaceae bacterium]|nr:cyclic pyranopterin monophosphate synthase MoaC [Planctomycetaceae bacterium]
MSTHFDSNGNARMVDVSAKGVTVREAVASGQLVMAEATAKMIRGGDAKKGDVLGVARLAAIQGSKQTATLIPLCHAIPIEAVSVDFEWIDPFVLCHSPSAESPSAGASTETLRCVVRVRTSGKTGVEMEALTAASIACLAVYDMVKSVDRGIVIGPLRLEEKSGGKSGDFRRKQGNSC